MVNKPYKECEDVKEAHGNLLSKCEGFEDYYLNVRKAKVADMENVKNLIAMINCIDANERRVQDARHNEWVDEHDKFKELHKRFRQEAAEKVLMSCDVAIESEENCNKTFREYHECVNDYNKLLKKHESIKSMREQK